MQHHHLHLKELKVYALCQYSHVLNHVTLLYYFLVLVLYKFDVDRGWDAKKITGRIFSKYHFFGVLSGLERPKVPFWYIQNEKNCYSSSF